MFRKDIVVIVIEHTSELGQKLEDYKKDSKINFIVLYKTQNIYRCVSDESGKSLFTIRDFDGFQWKPLDVSTHRATLESREVVPKDVIDDVDAKVYAIGDLEGRMDLLYELLIELKLISPFVKTPGDIACKWLGDKNTYVVQCGDQIDGGGGFGGLLGYKARQPNSPQLDLATLVFTDYLNEISENRFINLLGNHEWMNVCNDFRYVSLRDQSRLDINIRMKAFEYNGEMGRILRKRQFACRINNALFCHAGCDGERITEFIKDNDNRYHQPSDKSDRSFES